MNFTAFSLLIGMFFSAAFTSCQKGEKELETLTPLDMKNVAYGSDSAQNMDIYLPARRDTSNTKIILFIHGGSWSGGDKNEFNDAIAAIRTRLPQFAIFNMNYRLSSKGLNRFPVQIEDLQSAINSIANKANEYKVNANKYCLIGASAGAHLALLEAYKNNMDGRIKAVVDMFGPVDLTALYNDHPIPDQARPVLVNFLGATPSTDPDLYVQASPVNFVNTQTVPTKIFHGSDDIVVPLAQSDALKAKLQQNKVKVDLTVYSAEGHGWYGNNLLDTYQKTVEFIKENVR
ncbi:MAG TPA: alpha/beta hydrolase [Segetibacter sp.]